MHDMTDETSPDYVMVPREPTPEMLHAARHWISSSSIADKYKAMIAAAPPSPRSDDGSGLTPAPHGGSAAAASKSRDVEWFGAEIEARISNREELRASILADIGDSEDVATDWEKVYGLEAEMGFLRGLLLRSRILPAAASEGASPEAVNQAIAQERDAGKWLPDNPRPWSIVRDEVRDVTGETVVRFDPDGDGGFWPFIVAAVNAFTTSEKLKDALAEAKRMREHCELDLSRMDAERGRMREALMQARASFQAIQQATLEGMVCDDVAWFSEIETLHDYCASEIEIIDKSIARSAL
jgi:hypothetical protein